MKIFQLSVLGLLFLILISCKKDDEKISSLEGTWELKSQTNGTSGNVTEYPSNNGSLIIFSHNNYQTFSNHQLVKSGTFKVVEETSILNNSKGKRIIYDNDPDQIRTFFNVKGNSLEMYVDAFDGPTTSYIIKTTVTQL
jgi:nitrous oxide reductase accessory protein NosL